MKPAGSAPPKRPAPTATAATITMVRMERRSRRREVLRYTLVVRSKPRLNQPKNFPSGPLAGPWCALSSMAESAGASDSALKAESSTEIAMVKANCLYICPVRPPRKATGTKTAERIRAMPITGAETSFIAWMVASFGFIPCSMWCITASTTTMASSTTMPMASTKPNIERVLTEKPSIGKKMKGAVGEKGKGGRGVISRRNIWRKEKNQEGDEDDRLDKVW